MSSFQGYCGSPRSEQRTKPFIYKYSLKPGQGIHYKSTDREVQMLKQEVREDGERYRAANGITGKN